MIKPQTQMSGQRYNRMNQFVAQRLRTCEYRFYRILQARRKEIPRLADSYHNPEVQEDVAQKILAETDQYVNCLRKEHDGAPLPDHLLEPVNAFRHLVYSQLGTRNMLEDNRINLGRKIYLGMEEA